MAKEKMKKLWCVRTNGRWNAGDAATFPAETAADMLKAKGSAWVDEDPKAETGPAAK